MEKRLYFLTMRNISPIQQGIQCGHAQMEYSLKYWDDSDFQDWARFHKTWIILNGGVSSDMVLHQTTLLENNIKFSTFEEPDLNFSLSAIAILADERVFNREDYPNFVDYCNSKIERNILMTPLKTFEDYQMRFPDLYTEWENMVGGKENAFLKQFLSQFKTA